MTDTPGALVIRADASSVIGTGHVMRCLALAQAWQDAGGRAVFVTCCQSPALRQRLVDEGCEIVEIAEPAGRADWQVLDGQLAAHKYAWVVLDGYHFDTAYQQRIRHAGHRLLVIDDMAHVPQYDADLILNQNLGADSLEYRCPAETRRLLGPRYALLRREFRAWRGWQREVPAVATKVLLTMGGADPENVTGRVLEALQQAAIPELEVRALVGASNPHQEALRGQAECAGLKLQLIANAPDMPDLMAWADLAVSAAGSTCWELAFMGLPALLLIIAENQRDIALHASSRGLARYLGDAGAADAGAVAYQLDELARNPGSREAMSHIGQLIVDGSGSDLVVEALRNEGWEFAGTTTEATEPNARSRQGRSHSRTGGAP